MNRLLCLFAAASLFGDSPPPECDLRTVEIDRSAPCFQRPFWSRRTAAQCERTPELSRSSIEASSGGEVPKTGGVFCDASFLIWQSKMWGFEFAGKSTDPTNEDSPSITLQEKAFVPDFAWRPGFKVDVGYDFSFDGWGLDSRWTYYQGETTHLKKHIDLQINPTGLGVVPLWFYPFYTVLAPNEIRFFEGVMSWRHYFNSIDLEIGRLSSLSDRFTLHLFSGVKGAWMHQYCRVEYEKGSTIEAIVPGFSGTTSYTLLESAIAFKNKSYGGGPRFGFDSKWKMRWGFSLIANGAFSLLYSKGETHRDQNDLNLNTLTGELDPYHMYLKTDSHQLKPVVEAQLGLDWKALLYQRSSIGFTIAYEMQYWWAQNELRRNYSHVEPGGTFPSRGDLQMHGLTLTAGYHY